MERNPNTCYHPKNLEDMLSETSCITKGQPVRLLAHEVLRASNSERPEVEWRFPGTVGKGNRKLLFDGYRV